MVEKGNKVPEFHKKQLTLSKLRTLENPDGKRYTRIVLQLVKEFKTRFADFTSEEQRIMLFSQPFCFDAPEEIQLELLDLQANIDMKEKFREVKSDEISKNAIILDFYHVLPIDIYPLILNHARRKASLFGSTYTCGALFSKMKYTKNRYREKMTDEHLHDIWRSASTEIAPCMNTLLNEKKQFHTSH